LIDALDPSLHALVAGSIQVASYESDQAVINAALGPALAAERQEEADLVKEIRERAFAGGKAALGMDETLQTLREGRVHKLAISEALVASGEAAEAVQLALDSGAQVEFLQEEAQSLLSDNAGIGALLRY
jgi:peptide subunit release factor 1 (eRF1)